MAIRPEEIFLNRGDRGDASLYKANSFEGTVRGLIDYGFFSEVQVAVRRLIFKVLITRRSLGVQGIRAGEQVWISFEPAAVHTLKLPA